MGELPSVSSLENEVVRAVPVGDEGERNSPGFELAIHETQEEELTVSASFNPCNRTQHVSGHQEEACGERGAGGAHGAL